MTPADITLAAFTLCNSLRVLAYLPQIARAARDPGGAQAISFATWGLFLLSNVSAVAYALVNKDDWTMAAVFLANGARLHGDPFDRRLEARAISPAHADAAACSRAAQRGHGTGRPHHARPGSGTAPGDGRSISGQPSPPFTQAVSPLVNRVQNAGHELDVKAWQQGLPKAASTDRTMATQDGRSSAGESGVAQRLARDFDIKRLDASFLDDPFPTYRALREHDPIHRMPDGSYFLSRYDDCAAVYRDPDTWSSDKRIDFRPNLGDSSLYEHHTTSLVFNDPPYHSRVRKLLAPAFAPRALAALQPRIEALVDRLLDRAAARGAIDLISDFAAAIPAAAHRRHAGRAGRMSVHRCATGRSRSSARSSRC